MRDARLRQLILRVLPTLAFFALLSFLASVPQARADLILTNAINITGTGLGAVNTLTTAQDNGPPAPGNDGIESGCVGRSGGADVIGPSACLFGLPGGDEQASNQTVRIGDMVDANGDPTTLMNLGDIVLIFNLAETGMDVSVGLANLFFAVYDTTDTVVFSAELTAAQQPSILTQGTGTGTGGSGFTFILDAAQYAIASLIPFTSDFRIGGGFETVRGTTNNGLETVFTIAVPRSSIPEPTATAMLAIGFAGIALSRRRRKQPRV